MIHISFHELDIFADVKLRVLNSARIPNVLCLNDMKDLGTEIGVQKHHIRFGNKAQSINFINGLLYHVWIPDVAMFRTVELQKQHRSLVHLSFK